jgi:hypothetical protein
LMVVVLLVLLVPRRRGVRDSGWWKWVALL